MRFVVVGLGAITGQMLPVLAGKPWYETAALVDIKGDVLADARSRLGDTPAFTDLGEALGRVSADVVLINTPSDLHYTQARLALEAGFHVLVAKPVTNDFRQATELVELAAERQLTLAVGQQIRYMRHYRAVEQFVSAGRLGSVEAVNLLNAKPRPNPANLASMAQPALYEMACHHFDSLLAILGDRLPETIACDGFRPSWSSYTGPCMVNALIHFRDGLHVLYQCGFSSQGENYELRLEGSAGVLRCRGVHMSVDTMTNELAEPGSRFALSDIDADIPVANPWDIFLDAWFDYLEGGEEPPFSGRNNLRAFALLSAGVDSVNSGGAPVEVAANPRYASAFPELQQAGRA